MVDACFFKSTQWRWIQRRNENARIPRLRVRSGETVKVHEYTFVRQDDLPRKLLIEVASAKTIPP